MGTDPDSRAKSLSVQAIAGSLWHNMTKARLRGPPPGSADRSLSWRLAAVARKVHVMKLQCGGSEVRTILAE
jgi:hypothetical protein